MIYMKKIQAYLFTIPVLFVITLSLFVPLINGQTITPTLAPTTAPIPPTSVPTSTTTSGPVNTVMIAEPTPVKCISQSRDGSGRDVFSNCPSVKNNDGTDNNTYSCAPSYAEWQKDKRQNFWVYDPEITALGKGGERSRQFLYWVLTHPSDDDSPVILQIWQLSRNIAYFLLLIIAIFMGLGIIIGQRNNFDLKVEISPLIIRLLVLLLYVTFSASIILLIMQVSDILMEFFIRTLGVRELFNIFFVPGAKVTGNIFKDSETAYQTFQGCSNLKIDALESVRTSKFLIKFTNMTYYFIGIMFVLRKIVLWLLLIVAPFLAILAPFVFIRNIGWIWIGVFFQWVFYGPLMALFLGALARIWNNPRHIPFIFDFSRVNQMGVDYTKIIYPTTTNILYGGPAQKLELYNSASYVDTFAEYVIALIMLWAVIILPWWLLRIFRDYCCDGIMAMKNVLMAMYDSIKGGGLGPPPPGPTTPTPTSTAGLARELPRDKDTKSTIRIENLRELKQMNTQDIVRPITVQVTKLTDIARAETNKETRQNITKNINYMQNPMKAETATDRQKFMAMRSELYERATKGDSVAKQTIAAFSQSHTSQVQEKERILKTVPQAVPVIVTTAIKVGLPKEKTQHVVTSIFNSLSVNETAVNNISAQTSISKEQVRAVLTTLSKTENMSQPAQSIVSKIAAETRLEKVKVENILKRTEEFFKKTDIKTTITSDLVHVFKIPVEKVSVAIMSLGPTADFGHPTPEMIASLSQKTGVSADKLRETMASTVTRADQQNEIVAQIAKSEGVEESIVRNIMDAHLPVIADPQQHIEDTISIPQTVSIEDYEEVKSMWTDQYEKGEVPVSESIIDRKDWINTDILTVTNILNKITSSDEALRQQGLDDVGYILPIFMINNMKGDELAVYLKAKLEAAKQVKKDFEKEEEVKQKVQQEQGMEFVDVAVPKKAEAEKTMTMSEELETPEKDKTIEEQAANARVKEEMRGDYEAGKGIEQNENSASARAENVKVDEIKNKLGAAMNGDTSATSPAGEPANSPMQTTPPEEEKK